MSEGKSPAVLLAESLMLRYPDPDSYPFKSWSYSQGFVLWGFIRLYEHTGRTDFRDYVLAYCDKHVSTDGTIPKFHGQSLDSILPGSVVLWAWRETGEERYRTACQQIRAIYEDYPRNPDGGHWHNRRAKGQMWVDGVFMSLMFLVRYGKYIAEGDEQKSCYDECVQQLKLIFLHCQKDRGGLLYHAWCEAEIAGMDKPRWASPLSGCSPEVWSEGLGWYAMALVEVLDILPECDPGRECLKDQLSILCRDLLEVQANNGLFWQVVDRPKAPRNFFDTSGSAMFLYTFIRAKQLKLLGGGGLDRVIERGYRGVLSKCVQGADGTVHVLDACDGVGVQNSYDDYVDYARSVDAKEAVAAVLWALTAVESDVEGAAHDK